VTRRDRDYGQTHVDGLNWWCPDCGAVVEFFEGRPIHNRWHAEMEARFLRLDGHRP
jgi:hypothetical protein